MDIDICICICIYIYIYVLVVLENEKKYNGTCFFYALAGQGRKEKERNDFFKPNCQQNLLFAHGFANTTKTKNDRH